MNLIQAVKAGGPIRRKGWADPLTVQECDCYKGRKHQLCPDPALMFPEYVDPKLTTEDILAEDWEMFGTVNDTYQDELQAVKRELETLKRPSVYIKQLQVELHQTSKDKGWHDQQRSPLEMHALIYSEIAEATEEVRMGTPSIYQTTHFITPVQPEWNSDVKPEGEAIELADAVIRILDYCESRGWNLGRAIEIKAAYNKTRPYRHGNKKF